jgi:hypothetical protein
MDQLRHLSRTVLWPLAVAIAALGVLMVARIDRVSDAVDGSALGSLAGVAIGLTVAALVLLRVSPRR